MTDTNVYGLPDADGFLEFGDQELVPKMTSILGAGGVVGQVRGLVAKEIKPVASAVVIGLGGSGVQTVARVKSAAGADRLDQSTHDAVAFLGIDSVGERQQNPPLPAGVVLGSDLLNLAGFNAAAYLRGQLPNDSFLQAWWDDAYKVPSGELTDGLKRERMLGRLCFQQEAPRIRRAVQGAFHRALGIQSDLVAQGGVNAKGKEIAVYLVASAVGGTGSSAFLEVLAGIHKVAHELNITPKIRAFVLLPGVFADVTSRQQYSDTIGQAQRANAYGFFKELDHFLNHEADLTKLMGYPEVTVAHGDLLHSVYLLDSNVGSSGMLNAVTDVYEIVAESIFQFLYSEMGRAILGVNGTNIERMLKEVDAFRKPRRYCSVGLSRIVFPGETYRLHLVMWWCDWFIRAGFLKEPSAEEIVQMGESEQAIQLLDALSSLVQRSGEGSFDPAVRGFLDVGRDAPNTLEANPEPAQAEEVISTLEDQVAEVTSEVRRTLEILRPRLVTELEAVIEASVFSQGASVPRGREFVKVVLKQARHLLADAESTLNSHIAMKASSAELIEQRMDAFAEAAARNPLEAVAAWAIGAVNDQVKTAKELARDVGLAIKDWSRAVYEAEIAQARRDYLALACRRLAHLLSELEGAVTRLQVLADEAKNQWERDELIGKDAGPEATSVLIPSDTLPEVEWSRLSRGLRIAISEEHGKRLGDEALVEFVERWIGDSLTRGFFDVGSADPLVARKAQGALLGSLERDAIAYALTVTDEEGNRHPRLPADLLAAARSVGEETRLQTALAGLGALSSEVCWSWDEGRFQLPSSAGDGGERRESLRPEVTTSVAAHESMAYLVADQFPQAEQRTNSSDPERVVALSCEWAVPIHCMPVVEVWHKDYRALAERRKQQRQEQTPGGIEPPNHVDKRFEQFAELVPEYFDPAVAAPPFVRGLLIAAALQAPETSSQITELYQRDHTRPPVSPLRQERGVGFVGRHVDVEQGALVPAPPSADRPLGAGWHQALRSLGLDIGLQNAIGTCWTIVFREIDPAALIELIDERLVPKIDAVLKKRKSTEQERETLGHLRNALEDLKDELQAVA